MVLDHLDFGGREGGDANFDSMRSMLAATYCAGRDVLDLADGRALEPGRLHGVARSVVGVCAGDRSTPIACRLRLPLESRSADVAIFCDNTNESGDWAGLGEEIRRVLRPDGLLMLFLESRAPDPGEVDHPAVNLELSLATCRRLFAHVAPIAAHPPLHVVLASDVPLLGSRAPGEADTGQRNEALRFNAQVRISALRDELDGARRRSEDLLSEIARLHEQAANRFVALRRALSGLVPVRAAPLTRAVSLSAGRLASLAGQTLRRSTRIVWWTLTLQLRHRLRERRRLLALSSDLLAAGAAPASAPEPPPLPSRGFLKANPDWIAPQKRGEFIHLRGAAPRARIAIALHLFYPDLWPEMLQALRNMVEPFDLFATLVVGASEHVAPDIRAAFPHAHILTVDNHGRDILPFLELVRCGALFKYELVCKLHGKRTAWREGGDQWRQNLIGGVLGSPARARAVLDAFKADPDLGIVVADGQTFNGREFWTANEPRLRQLFGRIGLQPSAFEKSFVGGSMFWIRPWLLRPIDALGLGFDDFEPEPMAVDGQMAHSVERLISLVCYDAGMRIEQAGELAFALPLPPADQPRVRLIANYLPQFHPVSENDLWWGKGFTEWTNVSRASPLFPEHRQPRLPADLGFYDLRLPEVRQGQADLARRYGISAFSYYYYWFNGRRLLERPLDDILASGVPDFPFMICWANEPWTRAWDGQSREVLMAQEYAPGWERNFAADVAPLLRDPRYFRLNGRPVLAIYRVMHVSDPGASIRRLRASLAEHGISDVHLIGGWLYFGDDHRPPDQPEALGLDAYFEFPPHLMPKRMMRSGAASPDGGERPILVDYNGSVDMAIDELVLGSEGFRYRGVMTAFDNSPRRGRAGLVFQGATPNGFRRWLRMAVKQARLEAREPETAVFINAWNEWGEGSYLEPDRDFGHGWLEAVASVSLPAGIGEPPAARPS